MGFCLPWPWKIRTLSLRCIYLIFMNNKNNTSLFRSSGKTEGWNRWYLKISHVAKTDVCVATYITLITLVEITHTIDLVNPQDGDDARRICRTGPWFSLRGASVVYEKIFKYLILKFLCPFLPTPFLKERYVQNKFVKNCDWRTDSLTSKPIWKSSFDYDDLIRRWISDPPGEGGEGALGQIVNFWE